MKAKTIKTIGFFFRSDHSPARNWQKKIVAWLKKNYPKVGVVENRPEAVIVLGGDGTILDAALNSRNGTIIFGLNLGHVGFLASARKPKDFLLYLDKLVKGEYTVSERMMAKAVVLRRGREIFKTNALNEVVVQSPLGMMEIEISIEDHPVQYVRGTGAMVATSTGSTAFNLSTHGPIVMPEIKCFILNEILDHNLPTPSVVIKRNREIFLKVLDFRKKGLISMTKTGQPVDVLLQADGETIFPLEKGDVVKVCRSSRLIKFAEMEKHYFFKSLQEKFAFK